jgi:hypothetical protein
MSDAAAAAQRVITELKVSGHLMTLDNGVFCLFYAPGSAPPSSATGLPGVRLSLPPELPAQGAGQGAPPGLLSISTFREDGWLGGQDSAALIRVTRGPAQVLVTVYQDTDGLHEAPRLQVMRLSGGPDQAAPTQAAPTQAALTQAAPTRAMADAPPAPSSGPHGNAGETKQDRDGQGPAVPDQAVPAESGQAGTGPAAPPPGSAAEVTPADAEVAAHVQGRGDVLTRLDEWMGERGSQRWIEGFAIAPRQPVTRDDIEYQAVLGRGWLSPWSDGGHYCGSRGMALPILGLRVRLRGTAAERFDCRVSATFVDGSAIGPTDTGEACEAESLAPLEAFHVEIAPRPALAATSPAAPAPAAPDPAVLAPAQRAPASSRPAAAQEPESARPVRKPARATFKPAPPPRGKPAPVGRGKR